MVLAVRYFSVSLLFGAEDFFLCLVCPPQVLDPVSCPICYPIMSIIHFACVSCPG